MRSNFRLIVAWLLFALGSVTTYAETACFLLAGSADGQAPESYVVTTSDPALIQQARTFLANRGTSPGYLVPQVRIAAGADATNLNYSAIGDPAWPWHVSELQAWIYCDPATLPTAVVIPNMHGQPSDVTALLASYDTMTLVYYPLAMELVPDKPGTVVNVSARGLVGAGENVLILGFVVQGGTPRNVLIRALGPSLAGLGVAQTIADPKIGVYSGTTRMAENDNWVDGNFAPPPATGLPWYNWLFPANARESAVRLTLAPGAYAVHVSGADGGMGVALVDVHDLDALAPQ